MTLPKFQIPRRPTSQKSENQVVELIKKSVKGNSQPCGLNHLNILGTFKEPTLSFTFLKLKTPSCVSRFNQKKVGSGNSKWNGHSFELKLRTPFTSFCFPSSKVISSKLAHTRSNSSDNSIKSPVKSAIYRPSVKTRVPPGRGAVSLGSLLRFRPIQCA